jgi:lipopolysaccharide export LptBFGC system permease protein LptF
MVDLQAKLTLPLLSFIVTLLAIPIAFRARSGGSVVASLGVSLTLAFAYYIVISLGISLGHAGKLPPYIAAWLPNLFFVALAGYLWMDLEK